ncbi:MAG: type III-B CRISPR module-associated protein Cmr5 [Deltaproteobacteria bacterium]|nr:type III-B CRISPR module-associated protein Cmr5 [Deltaproteobacteria bacterium]
MPGHDEPGLVQTLDQLRAGYAWFRVQEAEKKGEEVLKKYTSLVKKLPAVIAGSGLGQALAFLRAKAKSDSTDDSVSSEKQAHRLAYDDLDSWLRAKPGAQFYVGPYVDAGDVLRGVREGSQERYRHARAEALAVLSYLRLFADGLKKEKKAGKENGDAGAAAS